MRTANEITNSSRIATQRFWLMSLLVLLLSIGFAEDRCEPSKSKIREAILHEEMENQYQYDELIMPSFSGFVIGL